MDCIVHGVTKSQTRLSDFHFHKYLSGLGQSLSLSPSQDVGGLEQGGEWTLRHEVCCCTKPLSDTSLPAARERP